MEIQRLNDSIGAYLSRRNDKCIRLLGLEQRIAEGGGDSEIMDYFLCNNRLVLSHVSNTDMYFSVKDYLEYFDRDMAERAINNRSSYVYRPDGGNGHNAAASEKMQKLMQEIFVSENPRLRIRFCAAYRFDLNGSVSAQTGDFSDYTFDGYMPNTHIDRYHCMGNYSRTIHDMKIAQRFAELNRQAMMDTIVKGMGFHVEEQFTTIHNYIDVENMILRKGSVSAQAGERLLIPINMRDGSLLCTGKGNEDWNFSAPHGAGRLMSRSAAKETFTVSEFKKQMEGIYTTSVGRSTLDECPMAYKGMDDIVNNVEPTVTIDAIIKPIYNFKAGEEE